MHIPRTSERFPAAALGPRIFANPSVLPSAANFAAGYAPDLLRLSKGWHSVIPVNRVVSGGCSANSVRTSNGAPKVSNIMSKVPSATIAALMPVD
jgi:hypothetical protein